MFRFIDVSLSQRGIDFAAMADEIDGVFIKASGANDGLYVAGAYLEHVERARPVWGNVGHYFFNGPGDPNQHAAWFCDHIDYQDGDALALDIENEGTMPAYTPEQAFAFIRYVKDRLDVVPILYMSASVARSHDWSPHVAFGAKLWVASYGSNTGTPGDEPVIGSHWGEHTIWQYTSLGTVPGWPRGVDLNLSPIALTEVHAMPRTLQGVLDWARANPKRDGGSWAGWCASFCYRAGAFSRSFTSAMAAGDYARDNGGLNLDWRSAPKGAIHYWAGVSGFGHCAFELGDGLLLMASSSVTESWGTAMGTVTFEQYARLGIPYRGWSLRWGSETLATSSTAGGGYTPIEEEDMPITEADADLIIGRFLNRPAFTHNPDGSRHPAPPTFSEVLRDVSVVYHAIFNGGGSMRDGGKSISQSLAEINAKSGANLSDAQIAAIASQVNAGSAEQIAAFVEGALADDFAGLRAALAQLPDDVRQNIKDAL